jgi:hypothetical protein
MTEPFLSRWSKRKQAVAQGLPVAEPEPSKLTPAHPVQPPAAPVLKAREGPPDRVHTDAHAPETEQGAILELPSLDDARTLTPKSDFRPFMQQGVASDVRNAAVKKLFTDPHFNVMDGLDIYIGDYNTPDPMPAGMLQKMVGAQLLGLLDKPDEAATPTAARVDAVLPGGSPAAGLGENPDQSPAAPEGSPVVAQSPPSLPDSAGPASPILPPLVNVPPEHDHPDLQLQPNHAPASPSPGSSTG